MALVATALMTQFLQTFVEFPPRQRAASFTVDQAVAKLEASPTSGQQATHPGPDTACRPADSSADAARRRRRMVAPMNQTAADPAGIVVVFSRPSDFTQERDWSAWYEGTHLPSTAEASGARRASRWENIERMALAASPVGFTHVAIYEFDDIAAAAPALLDLLDPSSATAAPRHPAHTIIGVEVLRSAGGPWNRRLDPLTDVTGQVMAFVGPNDPAQEDEWNTWLDAIHIPDMVSSGAFVNATRWLRTERARFGPNYLTVYDVSLDDIGEAVALSGAAMGPAHEQGRLLECHAGGLRAALRRAG
jgi:hypothetical protein